MPYEPTEWVRGTKITASKLNNIESGVESVNSEYTPTTWAEGDIVTATKLNNIEQGIANASGGGGDFSTAEVTVDTSAAPSQVSFPVMLCVVGEEGLYSVTEQSGGDITTYTAVLYEGEYRYYAEDYNITTTGSAEFTGTEVIITGDCTITFNSN